MHREAITMRGGTASDLKSCLTSIANLTSHASELAKRSIQAAHAGDLESAMNLALEAEPLLDEAAGLVKVAFAISKQSQAI
jgi:hypothetical protein